MCFCGACRERGREVGVPVADDAAVADGVARADLREEARWERGCVGNTNIVLNPAHVLLDMHARVCSEVDWASTRVGSAARHPLADGLGLAAVLGELQDIDLPTSRVASPGVDVSHSRQCR